jgi:chromosome segregation ATPase
MVLGAQSNYNNREEQIESLNHRLSYLENQHYKVKNNLSNFTRELSPRDNELLSYIEAKLKATKKVREKVIEDETLQEILTSRTSNKHNNPRDEKDAKPSEKWEWIENEYTENMSMFNNDQEWAKATRTKFKDVFNTKKGSPSSMLRYGKYKGRN